MTDTEIRAAIRANLGRHILNAKFRALAPADAPASWGCCYVASEAFYHVSGGKAAGYVPMTVRHENAPHWFLRRGSEIIDLTADQFATPVPYADAKGCGFLTREPSRRARELIAAASA